MTEYADNTRVGVTPLDMKNEADWLAAAHREGKHSGRRLEPGCPACFPNQANEAGEAVPWPEGAGLIGVAEQFTEMARAVAQQRATGKRGEEPVTEVPVAEVPDLLSWWRARAEREIEKMQPQIADYGSYDLVMMGRYLADSMNTDSHQAWGESDAELAELGCGFYLLGKISRAMSAWKEGRTPSDDTITDIAFYAHMILRIREAGSWPGPLPEEGK